MKKLVAVAAFLCALRAGAQDLIIKYDFIKDKYTFYQDKKEITQPTIKRNYEVKVLVENLNPFVFITRCSWKQQVSDDNSSTSGLAGLFSGLSGGPASISTLLSGLNMNQFEDLSSRGSNSLLENNLSAKMSLQSAIDSYNKLFGVEQSLIKADFSTSKLKKLKYNPYLPADTLKRIAYELTANSMALPKNGPMANFSASNFIQWSSGLSNTLNEEYANLVNYSTAFLAEYQSYTTKFGNNFAESGMDQTVSNMVNSAKSLKGKYDTEDINEKVEALEQQYESIQYTPFTYSCNYMATGDMLSLTLEFFETSPSSRNAGYLMNGDVTDTLRKIRSKSINILIHGDMKVTTSIGIGFPTYFNNNKNWTNRDSLIYGGSGNNYAPCLATYINFYPYTGRNLHLGGTFGIGIPVQNSNGTSLNFFLGGSAVLGAGSKVVLHAGLAIGQITVLSPGQKEGDNLGDRITQPTTQKTFKPGAFFGISFALNK